MRRRSFVLGATAALTSWPAWIARAFDPAVCEPGERLEALFDGYRAARRAGKPLLVLIVPERDEDKWERGTWFGQVLNHGDDETLARLGLVTLCCATRSELERLVELDADPQEPLFATVDTAARPALARAYRVQMPAPPEGSGWRGDRDEWEVTVNRAIDAQIAVLGDALSGAIDEALARREPEPTRYEHERIARAILNAQEVKPDEVLLSAIALYRRADASPAERPQLIAALAVAVRALVVSQPIRGGAWASSGGCGVRIEGDDSPSHIACGMGYTPARSARFLYFFARNADEAG